MHTGPDPLRVAKSRREFLRFVAGSPLYAPLFGAAAALTGEQATAQALPLSAEIRTAADAINVFDLEDVCHKNVPIAHWGYMASGVDDDLTIKANRDGFQKIALRTRRLVDVSKTSMKTSFWGQEFDSPIFICPTGGHKMFHPDGEVGTARAAKATNTLQVLSTVASMGVEEVQAARGGGLWYQMYVPSTWAAVETMVKRVEAAGCPVMMVTVDLTAGRNQETYRRSRKIDQRNCAECHEGEPGTSLDGRPNLRGIDMKTVRINPPNLDWAFVDRLRKLTKMKLILKGIEAGEDAKLAVEHGIDGVLVSNHGGRAMETLRGTIDELPEVIAAVGGRIPVFLDGGIRRGTDIYKALALGAAGVGIGRAYLWGLGAFGQPGVERVVNILKAELALAMRQCGATSIQSISQSSLVMKAGA
jgi:4-hydroxymandelate oxidase